MTYKRKLIVYFLIAFFLYVIVDIGIQLNREKRFKTDSLRSNLHAYTEVVENYLASTKDTASVIKLLPENLRVSLINREGVLTYDNAFDISKAENHGNRPEVLAAKLRNSGSATRSSESTKIDYLYYARMLDDGSVIRTSLPYTIKLDDFLHRDSIILYIIILMFVTTLFILIYSTDKFGNVMSSLKKFVTSVEKGDMNYKSITFPDTDSGEIGNKIIAIYQQLEESKRKIDREKERNRELKQEMTNNIAHELKTPVSSIRGYLEILLGDKPVSEDKRKYFLERSYYQTLRLSDLINDVALITKMEEAATVFEKEKVNVRELAQEAIEELSFRINPEQVDIQNNLENNLDIVGNKSLIFAIFRNLLENAINYAGEEITIGIKCYNEDADYYYFLFYDTGCGVKPEYLEKIFDRFVRIDQGRSRRNGGTGLGLSIVKHAVMFHNGTIEARNRKTGGLEFYFTLKKRK